jgi:hypothetical protein
MTNLIAEQVPGYTYGTDAVAPSPITLPGTGGFEGHCRLHRRSQRYLPLAGEVLTGQTREVLLHWRTGIIAGLGLTRRRTSA